MRSPSASNGVANTAQPVPDTLDLSGTTIGGYRLEALVGAGSLGPLYRAVGSDGRLVALRLLAAPVPPMLAAGIAAEGPRLVGLRHPALASCYGVSMEGEMAVLAGEWLPDGSLSDQLDEAAAPVVELLDVIRQAADALAFAHRAGVVHGALAPGSLMLQPRLRDGQPQGFRLRLADLGVAPLLEAAGLEPAHSADLLTYALAPERCQGLSLTPAADIYALGAMLYRVVAGRPPFAVGSLDSAVFAHVYQPPLPLPVSPEAPPALTTLVMRCLAKQPAERVASAGELAAELALILAELAAPAQLNHRDHTERDPQPGSCPASTASAAAVVERAALVDEPAPIPAKGIASVGPFTLDRLVDEDDLGQRYRGRATDGAPVTVRLLPRALSADPAFRADFELQAARLVDIAHPHLADVVGTGAAGGRCFIASEPVDGPSLRSALDIRPADPTAWPLPRLLRLVADAAEALGAAHAAGLLHGGLRPSRLALVNDGVRVTDLGLEALVVAASEEETAVERETLIYAMAPERCQGLPLSPRSDVYALGVILYELLAGRPPFEAADVADAVYQHIYQPLVPPRQIVADVPPAVEQVALRCLARRPEERFADGAELAAALRAAITAPAPAPAARSAAGMDESAPAPSAPAAVQPAVAARAVRALDEPAVLVGQQIVGCQIERFLGLSETGPVYKVRHIDLDRNLALKIVAPDLAREPGFQRSFERDAARIATLRHRNIAELFDIGYDDGYYYLLIEWLPDGTLRNVLQSRAAGEHSWSLAAAVDLIRQAADGLGFAHLRGYVHGIVKPNNLLLQRHEAVAGQGPTWVVKLADCGVGRLIDIGERQPTAIWADSLIYTLAPERAEGRPLDARSDLYALGAILYEIATGSPPFEARTIDAAIQKHLYAEPLPPSELSAAIPVELEQIILRCLAKAPEQRFQSAAELSAALQAVLVSPALAPPTRVVRSDERAALSPAPAPSPVAAPWLVVLDQYGRENYRAPLSGDGLTVGSARSNDVVLEGEGVQNQHLQLDWDGQNASVTSTALAPDTMLGEAHLSPGRSYPWPLGTTLRLAGYWLQLDPNPSAGQPSIPAPTAPRDEGIDPGSDSAAPAATPAAPAEPPAPATVSHIGVLLEQELLTLTPGRPALLRLIITNMGQRVDHLTLSVEGVPEAWVQSVPPVQLNPGGQQPVTLSIQVPEEPQSRAGSYPVVVRAASRENSANQGSAAGRWTVLPYQRANLALRPRLARGWRSGRYRLVLSNEGNAPARFTLGGEDDEGVLEYEFSPAEPTPIEPGATARIQLRAKAQQLRWFGVGQRHSFTLTAKPVGEGAPMQAMGQLDQRVVLPAWLLPMLIAIATFVLMYGLAAPRSMARLPYYRFLNPTPLPTRTPPPTPTFAPTATREPTLTPTATATLAPTVPTATVAPTLPPPTVAPPPPTATNTPSPTATLTPTIGPPCLAGLPVAIEGEAPPGVPLVLTFDGRIVGGGVADGSGRFRIRLDPGLERPGLYSVTVEIRDSRQVMARITCIVPSPVPTEAPPTPPPTGTPVPEG